MRPASVWEGNGAVSLLNRLAGNRHLDDSRFADMWSRAVASGEPAVDPHLSTCAECQSRYAAFTDWLERLHDDARDEAEEAFPPERLAALRRLVASVPYSAVDDDGKTATRTALEIDESRPEDLTESWGRY